MFDLKKCDKIAIPQGNFYLGESTKEKSVGYLELEPHSSLTIHNRMGGIENLTQVKGVCVMIVFNNEKGTNYILSRNERLRIEPIGVWHIHCNPFDQISLTYWHFEGDIQKIIESIRKSGE